MMLQCFEAEQPYCEHEDKSHVVKMHKYIYMYIYTYIYVTLLLMTLGMCYISLNCTNTDIFLHDKNKLSSIFEHEGIRRKSLSLPLYDRP